jgi:two-component system invasion response regulator UvrY
MTRILLVDDHPVVRRGIRTILTERIDDAIVGESNDAADALRQVEGTAWDVALIDISLPGASGLDLIKQLRREQPALPLVVVSMHPAEQFARRALAAGALAYVTKDSPPEDYLNAIAHARGGRSFVSRDVGDLHARGRARPGAVMHDRLSDREYQILRLLGSGRTVSDIARSLGLSVKTISTYRMRVLDKLGMRTNAELMRYAIENSLLES